jgi:hypothetical protein
MIMNLNAKRKIGLSSVSSQQLRLSSSSSYRAIHQTNCSLPSAYIIPISRKFKCHKAFGTQSCPEALTDIVNNQSRLPPPAYLNDCGSFEPLHRVTISNIGVVQKDSNANSENEVDINIDWGNYSQLDNNLDDEVQVEERNNGIMLIESSGVSIEINEVDFHDHYMNRNEPCIILNLTDDWPAMKSKKWSIEMLLKTYGNVHFLYNHWFKKLSDGVDMSKSVDIFDEVTKLKNLDNKKYDEFDEYDESRSDNDMEKEIVAVDGEDQEELQNMTTLKSFLSIQNKWSNNHQITKNNKIKEFSLQNTETALYGFSKYSPNLPYIFDSAFDQGNGRNLLLDYTVPCIFYSKNEILRLFSSFADVEFRWFLLGPKYSGKRERFVINAIIAMIMMIIIIVTTSITITTAITIITRSTTV